MSLLPTSEVSPSMHQSLGWNTYDRDILEGLTKKGFKLTNSPDDAGFPSLANRRGGGYYFGQFPSLWL